jgi:hypothetical protein
MPRKAQPSAILGDVVAREDVTINTKGGSMTATLKKPLREKLGELGASLSAAAVEFASGQAVVLLSRVPGAANTDLPVRVRKVGLNRFEIGIESDGDEEADEVTAAFLRLKKDLFGKGRLRLLEPVTAAEWRAEMDAKVAAVEAALEKAGANLTETHTDGAPGSRRGRKSTGVGTRRKALSA